MKKSVLEPDILKKIMIKEDSYNYKSKKYKN